MKNTIDNEDFIPVVSEIASRLTEEKYGRHTWIFDKANDSYIYTDKAQDFFNITYDEIEHILITNLNLEIHFN